MRRAAALLALVVLVSLVSCAAEPPEGENAVSASVTEYREPETTLPETEGETEPINTQQPETESPETGSPETGSPETEPDETELAEVLLRLPASLVLEISERLSEVYASYTRNTSTVTEIRRGGEVERSEISSELLMKGGNASFRRTSDSGDEEYFLIDGFLCYGGRLGNYRFGGYDVASFSELAGNYFSLDAFDGGVAETDGENITLRFDRLTESGEGEIAEMLFLPEGYEIEVTQAELLFVTDMSAHMKEKKLTLSASVMRDGGEEAAFTLISHTVQSGINEENDLALPALTSYVLFRSEEELVMYESALSDIYAFFSENQAFELSETDDIRIGGALSLHIGEKNDYAYAKKIGASIESNFDTADGAGRTHILTHFNHRHGFSQINGGNIFVDTTINSRNLEQTLTEPFNRALLPFSAFGRIESSSDGKLVFALSSSGKLMLAREILLGAGISAKSVSVTSCDEASAHITLDTEGRVASLGFSISARVTADGKSYTLSRTHSLDVTNRGSAKVKVIYIEVEEEE